MQTSTGTSNSKQGNKPITSMQGDQISNTSIYSEQIHISTNHNILEQITQTFNFVISSSSNELWILFSFPYCLSVDLNLNLNLNF